jgi:hypothetical protein
MIKWVMDNYAEMIQILGLIVVLGEMITRLTPTKTDDGFVTRLGHWIDTLAQLARVPNVRKKLEDDLKNDPPV